MFHSESMIPGWVEEWLLRRYKGPALVLSPQPLCYLGFRAMRTLGDCFELHCCPSSIVYWTDFM